MSAHLKQDKPDTANRLDQMKQGTIGQPIPRVEGLAKVTGTAPYAAEYPVEGCVEGVLATATITRSNNLAARSTTSKWPLVNGSKLPG